MIENDTEMWPGWRAKVLGEPDGYRGDHRAARFGRGYGYPSRRYYPPVRVPENTGKHPRESDENGSNQDAGWSAVIALLGLCSLVSAVAFAVFGWPLP